MTDWMKQLHEIILTGVGALIVSNLSVLGIVIFQHRLWKDYLKRHKINGSKTG